MSNLLIKEIESGLLAEVNYAAAKAGLTQRQWVIKILEGATNGFGEADGVESPSEVRGVRGGVRDERGKQRRARGSGAGAVLRPHSEPPADVGGVDGGVQSDTVRLGVCERPYVGPPHAASCGCGACMALKKR